MTLRPLNSLVLLASTALLASCSSALSCANSHPYAAYKARPPLTAPAGVTMPKPDAAYLVPAGSTRPSAAPAATTAPLAQPCLVIPPQVLTPSDMTNSPKAEAPAKPTVPIGTHPGSGAGGGGEPPPGGSTPPPVAGHGSME
jgi:hypothetical protein